MKISIVCSDAAHPIYPWLERWASQHRAMHQIQIVQARRELSGGDILFLISCHDLIQADVRSMYKATLVVHASDLPLGRGWSPHIWQILEKNHLIKVTLLEAEDVLDSGAIWTQANLQLEGHETFDEINARLFDTELELMDFAVHHFGVVQPRIQDERTPTSYRKRTPADSQLDPALPLAGQFDLLRVADPLRFPAFFELRGHRYFLQITQDKPHAKK